MDEGVILWNFFLTCVMARGGGGEFDVDDDPLVSRGTPLVGLDHFNRC